MYAQVLYQQWKHARGLVAGLAAVAFVLPLFAVYYRPGDLGIGAPVAAWLQGSLAVGYAIAALAAIAGGLLGAAAWTPDTQLKHIYALSLPVTRAHFALLRFAAGGTLVMGVTLALAAGALLAVLAVDLPEGIHAYPLQLAARFGVAALTLFGLLFAVAAASKRTMLALGGVVLTLVFADLALSAWGVQSRITEVIGRALIEWPGPLSILGGRWALFDV